MFEFALSEKWYKFTEIWVCYASESYAIFAVVAAAADDDDDDDDDDDGILNMRKGEV